MTNDDTVMCLYVICISASAWSRFFARSFIGLFVLLSSYKCSLYALGTGPLLGLCFLSWEVVTRPLIKTTTIPIKILAQSFLLRHQRQLLQLLPFE